jgi:hypothetical protein
MRRRSSAGSARAEEVRASRAAVQQRAAGERGEHVAVAGAIGQRVRQVGEGVPGRAHHLHPHAADVDHVTVSDRRALELDAVLGADQVLRADRRGERETAGHVVVVQVSFEHVRDRNIPLRGRGGDPVEIALGIHHQRDFPVRGEVAAVAERGRIDGDDLDHF